MREILFIRHAETDMAGTFCGHSDPELSARGHVQLAELINKLHTEKIGAVYTSDLRRAHATGMAVAKAFDVDCHVRPELREINFGQWEGLTWEEVEQQNKAYARRWLAEYPSLPAPDGESFRDFERRVLEEAKFISREAEAKGHDIAVVTHAGVLRTILCALHGSSEEDARNRTNSYCSIVRHPVMLSPFVQPFDETDKILGE
jgi:broad specificity phosphatase PhoE